MTHKIEHKFQKRILVPISAIHENIDFMIKKGVGHKLLFSDGITAEVKYYEVIHALTPEFERYMLSIYGNLTVMMFLKSWFNRLGYMFTGLNFIYITCDAKT